MDKLPVPLLGMVASWLSVRDHLAVMARLSKSALQACKLAASWPPRISLRNVPFTESSWVPWPVGWNCNIRDLSITGGPPRAVTQWLESAAFTTQLLALNVSTDSDDEPGVSNLWTAKRFPVLQRLRVGSGEFEAFRAELPSLTSLDLTASGCNWSPRRLPALQELHLRGLVYLNPSVAPVLRTLELCGFPKGDHVEVLRQCSRLTALGLLLPKREPEPLRALLEAKLPLTAVDLLADRDAERIWPILHQVGFVCLSA